MSQPHHNPYAKTAQNQIDTNEDENVSMHNSPHSKTSNSDVLKTGAEDENWSQQHVLEEEEIEFDENPFQIPPSFNQLITEEMLHNNNHPYVFWASLRLPIPPKSDQSYGGHLRCVRELCGAHGQGRSPVCNFSLPLKQLQINQRSTTSDQNYGRPSRQYRQMVGLLPSSETSGDRRQHIHGFTHWVEYPLPKLIKNLRGVRENHFLVVFS